MVYQFETFEIDEAKFGLFRNGTPVVLEPKALRLLLFLAKNPGRLVRKQELLDTIWLDVSVSENALTRSIALLRKALDDSSREPRFIETVPTAGYRFLAPVQVVVEEPAVAARLEPAATPSAISNQRPDARRSRLGRIAWLTACGALIAGTVSWGLRRTPRQPVSIRSIAVLPLDNFSGDPAQEYLADGMTDELTTMLAKNSVLRVVSRTSVMQYRGAHRPLPDIARELGTDGIIEGSVARSGDKIHLNIQLIQAPSDTHVWAESYDRDAQEFVSLPREVSIAIAKRLNSAVPHPAAQRFVSAEAQDDYLRGRYLWFHFKNEDAGAYFKKATDLQPDYALGWAGLADYYGQAVIDAEKDPPESLDLQWGAARKAVDLDESLPEAHLALGVAIVFREWDFQRGDREIGRAIALNPALADAYNFRAKMYAALHRDQEAIEAEKKATELAPLQRPFVMAMIYYSVRQYDAAIQDATQKLEASPNDPLLHWVLWQAYRRKGDFRHAVSELEQAHLLRKDNVSADAVHLAFSRGGYQAVLRWQIASLEAEARAGYVSPVSLSVLYAQLGDRNHTLALLEEGYRKHSPLLLWIGNDPAYDFLHSDERYRAIIRGIALPVL